MDAWRYVRRLGWILLLLVLYGSETTMVFKAKVESGEIVVRQLSDVPKNVLIAQVTGTVSGVLGIILLILYLLREKLDRFLWHPMEE